MQILISENAKGNTIYSGSEELIIVNIWKK